MVRAYNLKQREVIDVKTAERLGYIYDVDIDFENGRINSLIIPNANPIVRIFSKKKDFIIPWENIVAIGKDVVLVRCDSIDVVR